MSNALPKLMSSGIVLLNWKKSNITSVHASMFIYVLSVVFGSEEDTSMSL